MQLVPLREQIALRWSSIEQTSVYRVNATEMPPNLTAQISVDWKHYTVIWATMAESPLGISP